MDSNQKKFGWYVFLSTFSRNLIEVFIPVILYKFGYSLKEVLFYYLMVNLISLILSYPAIYISNKYNNKILAVVGILAFIILQVQLNYMWHGVNYLLWISFLFAIYRRGYWISRRYYNLEIVKKEKIATTYSIVSILNQLGVIVSAYIGGLLLDYISLNSLTIIASILFLLSLIPLFMLKIEHEKSSYNINLIANIKKVPFKDLYLFGSYELINVVKFIIALYIFIYVKDKFNTIGLITLITNVAIICFIFLFGRKLDKTNKNFIPLSILLTVLIYIFKVNTVGIALFIISFLEGIALKMYELSVYKEFFIISKKIEYYNYNLIYEVTQNFFRTIVVLIFLLSNLEIRNMVYIALIFIFIGAIFTIKSSYQGNEYDSKF